MKIDTNNRRLNLKFDIPTFKSWRKKINFSIDYSPWSHKLERFVESSFAPIRKGNNIRLMIDGEMYFRNVADEISRAQSEIFITDWWLCPKYYLVRPICLASKADTEQYRLDCLLNKAVKMLHLFEHNDLG
jgi:phospholipase D1/2